MNPDIIYLISMTISILLFMNLFRIFKWSERFCLFMGSKFGVDPSYHKVLGIITAIGFVIISILLTSIMGLDKNIEKMIYGLAVGIAVSFTTMKKDDDGGVVGRYIEKNKKSRKS